MMRQRKALETLLRVRRLQRDTARQEEGNAARARLTAEEAARAGLEAAGAAQDALQQQAAQSLGAGTWPCAAAGVEALWSGAVGERAALEAARAVEADAAKRSLAAERSLAGVERLAERKAESERRQQTRVEQRRIDDVARRKPGALAWVLLLLTAALAHATPSWADASDRLASASLERLLSDIRTRGVELDRREAELREREQAVAELERAVEVRIEELGSMATTIEERLSAWEQSNAAKSVSKLAKIYGAMPPATAAPLIEELDLDLATQILAKMKPKGSAAVLPLLSESRALAISRFVGHPLGVPPNVPAKAKK